jgi:ABC-2 type transport system permease protein
VTARAQVRVLTALFRRDWLEAQATPWAGVSRAVSLAFAVGSTHLVARAVLGAPRTDALPGGYFAWLLSGFLFADIAHAAISGAAERLRALQLQGGLEVDLQGPTRGVTYLLGLSLFPVTAAMVRAAAVLAVAWGALGLDIKLHLTGLACGVLGVLALWPLGLLAASVTLVVQRADPLGRIVAAAGMLGSGIAYPREVLPDWALTAAGLLPTTPALDAFRAGVLGAPFSGADLMRLALGLGVGAALAAWVVPRAEAWARRHGRLSAD